MSEGFQIKVVNDEEFTQVALSDPRYEYVEPEIDAGFADPLKKIAYVRYVANEKLQRYLIEHEFEELVMSDSAHEDPNGIRHKGLFSIFRAVAAPIFKAFGGGGGIGKIFGLGGGGGMGPISTGAAPSGPQVFGGDAGGPLGAFSTGESATSRGPEGATGSTTQGTGQTGLNQGSLEQPGIDPALKERTKGFLSGRIQF